jgi:hypothetical protein
VEGIVSFGKQESQSQQSSGLNPGERVAFSNQAQGQFGNLQHAAERAAADPGGLAYRSTIDQLMPTGRYGMSAGADQGISQLGRDLFTQASANRAQRGFNTPYNLEAVLGDSMRMASGQLVPQANQWAMQRAQFAPALRQATFGYELAPMQAFQQLLTGSSQGGSQANGFQMDASKPLEMAGPAVIAM